MYSSNNIYEVVDRILCSKQKSIFSREILEPGSFEILNLDYYYETKAFDYELEEKKKYSFLNAYGNVSILLLVGSIFITLGVLISIIMMLGE